MLLRILSLELKAGQVNIRTGFSRPAPAEGVLIRFAQRRKTPNQILNRVLNLQTL